MTRDVPFLLLLAILPACSSSSSGAETTHDGGTDATRDAPGDAAAEASVTSCPPSSIVSVPIPPYAPAAQKLNACSASQISSFVAACLPGDTSDCSAWLDDSSNDTCKACMIQQGGSGTSETSFGGVLLLDDGASTFFVGGNKPGCQALVNAANGGQCASGLEPLLQCDFAACLACSPAQAPACSNVANVDGGACAMYVPGTGICQGADAGFTTGACGTDTQAINVICGTGS